MVDTDPHRSRGFGASHVLGLLALLFLVMVVWWWWPSEEEQAELATEPAQPAEVGDPVNEPGDASRTRESIGTELVVGPDAVEFEGSSTAGAVEVAAVAGEGLYWIGPEEGRILAVVDPRSDAQMPDVEAGATLLINRGDVLVPDRIGELEELLDAEALRLVEQSTAVVLIQPQLVDVQ